MDCHERTCAALSHRLRRSKPTSYRPASSQRMGEDRAVNRGGSHCAARRRKQPLRRQQRLKAAAGAARARVVAAELLLQVLVAVDDTQAPLDLGLRREALASLARDLETGIDLVGAVSRCPPWDELKWSPRPGLNGHALRPRLLKPLRLPVPPRGVVGLNDDRHASMRSGVTGRNRTDTGGITTRSSAVELRPHLNARLRLSMNWSRRSESNGRPHAPKASALPAAPHRGWIE